MPDLALKEDAYTYSLCRHAVDKWGAPVQVDQIIEELAELIIELNHFRRNRINRENLLDEVADVELMLFQLKFMLGVTPEEMGRSHHKKVAKLAGKLFPELEEVSS